MKITVTRTNSDDESTISEICVDGDFVCYGLEDEFREDKVPGETRIPPGTYQVGLRATGGFHGRYTSKFPNMHRGMLQVLDVPGFEYILIHIGNTDKDTAGCLLVGTTANRTHGAMSIGSSKVAYKKLYPMLVDAADDDDLTIEYIDKDL